MDKKICFCSFCAKSQHEVRKLIAGPTVFICDECVELCMDIAHEDYTRVDGEAEYLSWDFAMQAPNPAARLADALIAALEQRGWNIVPRATS